MSADVRQGQLLEAVLRVATLNNASGLIAWTIADKIHDLYRCLKKNMCVYVYL